LIPENIKNLSAKACFLRMDLAPVELHSLTGGMLFLPNLISHSETA